MFYFKKEFDLLSVQIFPLSPNRWVLTKLISLDLYADWPEEGWLAWKEELCLKLW